MAIKSAKHNKFSILLKLTVTVFLVLILWLTVDWRRSFEIVVGISVYYIPLLVAISFLMIAMSCIKWQLFLSARNIRVPLIRLIWLYVVGYFFNMFLPSNVGGDVARGMILGKQIRSTHDSFSSVFMERFTGLLGLLIVACLAFVFNMRLISQPEVGGFLLFSLVAFAFIVLLLMNPWLENRLDRIPNRGPLKAAKKNVSNFLAAVRFFRTQPIVLSKAMLLSFLFHFMTVVNTFVVCLSLGISAGVLDLAAVVPMVLIVSVLPISFNGIGVWEGSFVYFFSLIGIPPAAALSIALVLRAKSLFTSLVGGVAFLAYNKSFKESSRADAQIPLVDLESVER